MRPRAPLPPGVPNYVTARGLAALRDELARLTDERTRAERLAHPKERGRALGALARRRADLEERIATAEQVAPPPANGRDAVRFGARVGLAAADGGRSYRIVGVDEADAASGAIAFTSPLARALLGKRRGDTVRLRAPRGDEELEIASVEYEDG